MGRWSKVVLAGLVCVALAVVPPAIVIAGGNSSSGSVARQTGSWVPSSVEARKEVEADSRLGRDQHARLHHG